MPRNCSMKFMKEICVIGIQFGPKMVSLEGSLSHICVDCLMNSYNLPHTVSVHSNVMSTKCMVSTWSAFSTPQQRQQISFCWDPLAQEGILPPHFRQFCFSFSYVFLASKWFMKLFLSLIYIYIYIYIYIHAHTYDVAKHPRFTQQSKKQGKM
jgi:hypothetical protein